MVVRGPLMRLNVSDYFFVSAKVSYHKQAVILCWIFSRCL